MHVEVPNLSFVLLYKVDHLFDTWSVLHVKEIETR
jgi:hypothetical protein